MKKYEYKADPLNPFGSWGKLKLEEYEKILNKYGEEGYELVSLYTIENTPAIHIFKKEK
tara:strand:+ start:377 stop:553 length:177 start_codon:yes stop_codon:yes gene_type:complete